MTSNWMENLQPSLKSKPIIHLAIPGAHDCMTYTISSKSEVSPDNDPTVAKLLKAFGKYGRKYMHRWCKTQDIDIEKQLNSGIRYLDFRVATKSDSQIYFCHGLYGEEVTPYLQTVNKWLDENKGEIVIMDFQHFYGFVLADHLRLINEKIKATFGEKLCPYTQPETKVTLEWMLEHGYRAIVVYRDRQIENRSIPGLWPGPSWPTPWPDATDTRYLMTFVEDKLSLRSSSNGFVTQLIMTPDAKMISWHFLSNLKNTCAKPVLKKAGPWLKGKHPGPNGVNVVIADFVETGSFYDLVIGLNNYFVE